MKNIITVLLLVLPAFTYADIEVSSRETIQLEIIEYDEQIQDEVCVPDDITTSQAREIVAKYIRDNPELPHKDELAVASNALLYSYPCIEDSK